MTRSNPPGFVSRLAVGTLRRTARVALHALTGGLLVLVVVAVVMLDRRPDLEVWHEADLDEEFTVDTQAASFSDYTALEDRLFAQLETLVYARVPESNRHTLNRFKRGSISDPRRFRAPSGRTSTTTCGSCGARRRRPVASAPCGSA